MIPEAIIISLCNFAVFPAIAIEAQHAGVPPRLAMAVALTESRCDPFAGNPLDSMGVAKSSAVGLFQVLSFWTRSSFAVHCNGTDLTDPATNICYGIHILRHYERRCNGNWKCALRRYSGHSPGYVQTVLQWLNKLDHHREVPKGGYWLYNATRLRGTQVSR